MEFYRCVRAVWDLTLGRYNLCTLLWISGPLPASIVATAIVVEDTLLESLNDSSRFFSIRVSRCDTDGVFLFACPPSREGKDDGNFSISFVTCHFCISFFSFFFLIWERLLFKIVKIIYERTSTFFRYLLTKLRIIIAPKSIIRVNELWSRINEVT